MYGVESFNLGRESFYAARSPAQSAANFGELVDPEELLPPEFWKSHFALKPQVSAQDVARRFFRPREWKPHWPIGIVRWLGIRNSNILYVEVC